MADQRSKEMLVFMLAKEFSRALSAFSSFMREYLDKVIKADQCAQYVDDIGRAAKGHVSVLPENWSETMHKC